MDALADIWVGTRGIDEIVNEWSKHPPLDGAVLASVLIEWNDGVHDLHWIHKKAYSAMRTHIVGPLIEDMNEGLGIERDHRD